MALLLGLVLVFSSAQAEVVQEKEKKETWQQSLINDNRTLSQWFDGMADGLDIFLAGQRLTPKKNTTQLIVESSFFYSEIARYSDATSFNFNLRLPNVEEYWQLTFTSYDETRERSVTRSYLRQQARELDYGARLGFIKKLGNIRTAFQPRLGFAGRFKISHSLTFESIAEQPDGSRINPKLEFYADADKGAGIFQAVNFNIKLNDTFSLTQINEGDYQDRPHFYLVTHALVLGQKISDLKSLNYGIFFNFVNNPNYQLSEYILSPSWTHTVYRNILEYQIIPYINFSGQRGYAGYQGVTLNLRLYF